jgi:hypothetical protein
MLEVAQRRTIRREDHVLTGWRLDVRTDLSLAYTEGYSPGIRWIVLVVLASVPHYSCEEEISHTGSTIPSAAAAVNPQLSAITCDAQLRVNLANVGVADMWR